MQNEFNLIHVYRFHADGSRYSKKNFRFIPKSIGGVQKYIKENVGKTFVVVVNGKLYYAQCANHELAEEIKASIIEDALDADLESFKAEHVGIAMALHYPQRFIDRILNAKTENEILRIMHDARCAV